MSNTLHNPLYIRSLAVSLSKSEVNSLKKYLSLNDSYSQRGKTRPLEENNSKSQYLQYLELLLLYSGPEDSVAIDEFLGAKFNLSQRRTISSRLMKRVEDFLLMELTLIKGQAEPDRVVQQFLLRRIVILDVLLTRRLFPHFDFLSNKLIGLADKYERYIESATIIRMRMMYLINRIKGSDYLKLLDEYNLRMEKHKYVFDCSNYAIRIQHMYNEKYRVKNIVEYLVKIKNELENVEVDSDNWRISRNLIFLELAQQRQEYELGDIYCNEIISIYKRNKFISNIPRISNAYRQLANNQLLGSKFNESIKSTLIAIKGYPTASVNWIASKELIILSLIYLGKVDEAHLEIQDILKLKQLKSNNRLFSRLNYYIAIIYFHQNDFSSSLKYFYLSSELHDDKGGWGFGIRMYIFIIYIEIGDYNSLLLHFDSFRIYFDKYNKIGEIGLRFQLFYKVMKLFVKFDLNWIKIKENSILLLNELDSDDYRWDIKSPEIYPFDNWLKSKFESL